MYDTILKFIFSSILVVRWLSRGKALKRFAKLLDAVIAYMKERQFVVLYNEKKKVGDSIITTKCKITYHQIENIFWQTKLHFLIDILSEFNKFNVILQGKENYIGDQFEVLLEYKTNFSLLSSDIASGDLDNFPSLKTFLESKNRSLSEDEKEMFSNFIKESILEDLNSSFEDVSKLQPVFNFIQNPFGFDVTNNDEISKVCEAIKIKEISGFRRNVVHLQSQKQLRDFIEKKHGVMQFSKTKLADIWKEIFSSLDKTKSETLKKTVAKIFSIFGTTWTCEALFSKLPRILNKDRTNLTQQHIEDQLRISSNKTFQVDPIAIHAMTQDKNDDE